MKWGFRILIILFTVVGIGLMAYPLLGNIIYENQEKELTAAYERIASEIEPEKRNELWNECAKYNEDILNGGFWPSDPFGEGDDTPEAALYNSMLDIGTNGAMGSIEAPGFFDPILIYHGTSDEAMQRGAGHMSGTSLPTGGKGTHAVLSAHTGLSSKQLFTNLDQMKMGNVFYISILGEKHAYKVDQINVVLPHEAGSLRIDPDKDYVTLITCTPYGVNSHRLLVRGTRIPYEEAEQIANEQKQQQKGMSTWTLMYLKAIGTGAAIAAGLWIILSLLRRIRKAMSKRKEEKSNADKQEDS
ncbi:MAG: class C sortase [Oscillospiraceae bacterium]|nr:class C sortase [Oscillospiraceae bacterium]